MRQSVDVKPGSCSSSCSGMHLLRGISYGLRTAIGVHGTSSTPHLGSSCRHLELLHQCSHLAPVAAGLHASARHRRQLATAASNGQTDPAQHAANGSDTAAESSSSETSSSSSSSSNRLVKEPVAAVGSVANGKSMHAAGAGSSSSSSKGPLKPPGRRMGPQGLKEQQRRAGGVPPTRAVLTTAPPVLQQPAQAAQSSNGSSSSSSSGTQYANGSSFSRTDSSSSSSSSASSSSARPSQQQWLQRQVTDADRYAIRDKGITALSGWVQLKQAWPQLQQQWEQATQQLPAAMERLLAVSRSGPLKVVVFDIETTGLRNAKLGITPEIIELAAAAADGTTFPSPSSESLMRPLGEVPDSVAKRSHELYNKDLLGAPCAPVVMLQWVEWLTQQCQAAPGGSSTLVLAGHNIITFDELIVAGWLETMGLGSYLTSGAAAKALGWGNGGPHLPWLCIDTLAPLAKAYRKNAVDCRWQAIPESAGLQDLKAHFNVASQGQAHRALADVRVNQQVYRHLLLWRLGLEQDCSLSLDELSVQYLTQHTPNGMQLPAQLLQQAQQQQGHVPPLPVQQQQQALAAQQQGQQVQQQQPMPDAPPRPAAPRPASPRPTTVQTRLFAAKTADSKASSPDSQTSKQTVQQPLQQQQQGTSQLVEPAARTSSPQQQQQQQQQLFLPQTQPMQIDQIEPDPDRAEREEFLAEWDRQLVLEQQRLDAARDAIEFTDPSATEKLAALLEETKVFQQEVADLRYQKAAAVAAAKAWEAQQAERIVAAESGVVFDFFGMLERKEAAETATAAEAAGAGVQLEQDSSSSSTFEQLDDVLSSSDVSSSSSSSQIGGLTGTSSPNAGASSSKSSSSSSSSSSRGSGERGDGSNIKINSSDSMTPLDPKEVEDAVAAGLESLATQDLTWDPHELSQGWPLLGDPLNKKDKIVSAGLYDKLLASGFSNHLQVLQQCPPVVQFHDSIPLEGASSSSLDAEDSTDGAEEAGDTRPYVFMRVKCLGAASPRTAPNGVIWSAVFEAPTNPPSAGPAGVKVSFFQGVKYNPLGVVQRQREGPYTQALAAVTNGIEVLLKGRLKPHNPDEVKYTPKYNPSTPDIPITWEATSSPEVEISWDGSDTLSSKIDCGHEILQAQYKKKDREMTAEDWAGSGRSQGVITPLLGKVREQGMQDVLPEALRQQHGLGNWLEDLEEAHKPTTPKRYEQACRGLAMRELVLMQVAQFLERYRLTTAPGGVIAAAADVLLPYPDTADAAAAAPKPKRAAGAKAAKGSPAAAAAGPAGSRSYSSSSTTTTSSSSSEEEEDDVPLSSRSVSTSTQRPDQAVMRHAEAYRISNPEAVAKARQELAKTWGWDLTEDQERVLREVQADMQGPRAMLRLLQGDVGCGKTIIALLACLETAASGKQALLFAPTELLATQHYNTLARLADELPLGGVRPRMGILTGSKTAAEKRSIKANIAQGQLNIIISTQAALYVDAWDKLALVVVDEQHKLGVKQRERLTKNLDAPPHMLLMTATPIPRTLAIMQYGGLSLSTIMQLPPGRTPVETHVVLDEEQGRQEVYAAIKREVATGGRAYIVCPLVAESGSGSEQLDGVRTVEDEYRRLRNSGVFGEGSECGMLHGKMSAEEKAAVLDSFKSGKTHVLIASTVVEVGVDVPEASVMLVEGAHRFGLAQLHQLRGRVGRGSKASKCFLMAPAEDQKAFERLQELERSNNGLHIAEADLRIRGPGDLWSGTKQSGKTSQLSIITRRQLKADPHIVEHARLAAAQLLLHISKDTAVKAALLACGIMELRPGQKLPVARYGISGM